MKTTTGMVKGRIITLSLPSASSAPRPRRRASRRHSPTGVKGAKKARRGYAFMYGNADAWDVIRDCHEKSIRTANGGELHVSSCHEAVDHVSEKGDLGT